MSVSFRDLRAQHLALEGEIDEAVVRVLQKVAFVLGPELAEFKKVLAVYYQPGNTIAVNSSTSALQLSHAGGRYWRG